MAKSKKAKRPPLPLSGRIHLTAPTPTGDSSQRLNWDELEPATKFTLKGISRILGVIVYATTWGALGLFLGITINDSSAFVRHTSAYGLGMAFLLLLIAQFSIQKGSGYWENKGGIAASRGFFVVLYAIALGIGALMVAFSTLTLAKTNLDLSVWHLMMDWLIKWLLWVTAVSLGIHLHLKAHRPNKDAKWFS